MPSPWTYSSKSGSIFADPVPLIIPESNNGNPLQMSTMGIQVEIMHWLRIFMQAYSAISDGRFPALKRGEKVLGTT